MISSAWSGVAEGALGGGFLLRLTVDGRQCALALSY